MQACNPRHCEAVSQPNPTPFLPCEFEVSAALSVVGHFCCLLGRLQTKVSRLLEQLEEQIARNWHLEAASQANTAARASLEGTVSRYEVCHGPRAGAVCVSCARLQLLSQHWVRAGPFMDAKSNGHPSGRALEAVKPWLVFRWSPVHATCLPS